MYPKADIPVFRLSVNADADAQTLFRIGEELAALREKASLSLTVVDISGYFGYRNPTN